MSVLFFRKYLLVTLAVLLVATDVIAAGPGIGFQARLSDPPRVVSAYDDQTNRFSAATYPLTFAVLSPKLLFNPKAEYGDFAHHAITFSTVFAGDQYLVPVSVDADLFLAYRTRMRQKSTNEQLFQTSLEEAKQGKKRQGLSIGVALPKRFDRMFGEGGANLRVSGYRRITFSGRSQWNDNANSGVQSQSKFPSLNMEQISQFDITGTIGTKISVKVSQDNQRDIPLANRLLLRYKGDDDDVLKTIEAGNTTLSLPNTQFVGYSAQIQGLFGLKAEAQLGNLTLTAIASQEKGSSESAVVSASGEENAKYIRDYNYATGRIFDLGYPGEFGPRDSVVTIYVYQQDSHTDDLGTVRNAKMMIDPTAPEVSSIYADAMQVKELDSKYYELIYGQDSLRSPIAIQFNSTQRKQLGVYMEIKKYGSNDTLKIGSLVGDTISLKYLLPGSDVYVPEHPTWQLMWRNCYSVSKNIKIDDIDVKVFKGLPDREGTTSALDYQEVNGESQGNYMQILGLDQYNNNRTDLKSPDDLLDDRLEVYRQDWGLIIFPNREPFNSDTTYEDETGNQTSPLKEKIDAIYYFDSDKDYLDESKYYLQISTKSRSSVIRLGQANVIEGSERVTLDGRVLQKGVDYSIQYDYGQVTLLSEEATDPNADVQIEYQYAPYMSMQKKTLLGMRAEYEYSKDLKLGSTILYKSDKAEDRKPRVGEETAEAMVMDFDVSFALYPNFLTKAVDALPLVSTEADSKIQVSAEVAQSRPNPNVDGVAYIDDFESAVERLSLGIPRTNWTMASTPLIIDSLEEYEGEAYERGTIRWHNPPSVLRENVYQGDVAAGEGSLTPLRLIFRPHGFGYAEEVQDGDTVCVFDSSRATSSWAGIMRYFGSRVDAERVQLFEVRAKATGGLLHFDFGQIDEDIDGDGSANSEDVSYPQNGALDDGEDVGLDNAADEEEVDRCGLQSYDPVSNPDPAGDNWWYNGQGAGAGSNDSRPPIPLAVWNQPGFQDKVNNIDHYLHYEWQNGTEGNIMDDAVQGIPDEENLSGTGLKRTNAYFSLALSLVPGEGNPYWVSDFNDTDEWNTFRIPIRDPGVVDTFISADAGDLEPKWSQITHVRVWFEAEEEGLDSLQDMDSLVIADWGFIQSNWRDTLILGDPGDSTADFYVASVSDEDGTFSPPPDVEAYYDKSKGVTEAQRGLAMVYDKLMPGDTAFAVKDLISTESYSGYRRLKMYVHGPEDLGADSVLFFLRVGLDTANYYEYRTLLSPLWAESNNVDIDFNDITALKDKADRELEDTQDTLEIVDGAYRVFGYPNINEVRYIAAGLVNEGERPVSGEVWMDELRVTDVRKDVGTAARIGISGGMADLLSYSFSYEYRDPYFRGISQATRGGSSNNLGSGKENTSMTMGTTLNMHKFLPRSWRARLPVSFNYSKSEEIPLLRTNSDVVLPDELREEEKSTSESYKVSVSEAFEKKGSNLLFNALLNRQTISLSYNRSNRSTVNNPYIMGETFNLRADYDMGVSSDVSLPVFFWLKPVPLFKKAYGSRMSFFPSIWKWNATIVRQLTVKDDKDLKRTSSYSRTFDGSMNMTYNVFNNLTTTFNLNTSRDITEDSLVVLSLKDPKLGLEKTYSQTFRASYDPKLLSWLTGSLSYSSNFGDTYNQTYKTLSTSLSRSWSVSGSFNHHTMLSIRKRHGGGGSRSSAPRRGGADPEDKAEKKKGTPLYTPVVSGVRFLTGWLNPLSYKYSESFSRTVPGALEKPGWKYRLGFDTDAEIRQGSTSQNPSSAESVDYELSSGFSLLGGIKTTVTYSEKTSRDLITVGQDRTETTSTSWPELTITIQKFTFLPLLKGPVNWFINVFSPRTGYSRQIQKDANLDRGFLVSKTETIGRSPLLSLNLKLFRSFSLSGSYSRTNTYDWQYNRTTGLLQSETRSVRKTLAVTSKYAFSAPGGISIPLFGKLKFKSTVSIDVTVRYNSNLSETSTNGMPFVIGQNKSDFTVSPVIRYTFSQQITGGITARWQDNNDIKYNRKSHVRELQIWAEIRF